jgi:ureidoglycolate lyase
LRITVELLTEAAFEPFGRVLGEPASQPPNIVDAVSTVWLGFSDLMGIGAQAGQAATFLKIHTHPPLYDKMEKHDTSAEAFIPLEGRSILLVAPWQDVDAPDMHQARAFLMDGCQGVLLHPGAWHAVPYNLTDVATYLVLVDPAIIAKNDLHITPVEPVEFILDSTLK